MVDNPEVDEVAGALHVSVGLLLRRLRQTPSPGELTLPETAALTRLDRSGPTTPGALAKADTISPQAMGATLNGLEKLGLVRRGSDPEDGRRVVMSLTDAGRQIVRNRRNARTQRLATALAADFTHEELDLLMRAAPLIERLAHSI
jgi:DNA-binding MarR family transcriptional regulator